MNDRSFQHWDVRNIFLAVSDDDYSFEEKEWPFCNSIISFETALKFTLSVLLFFHLFPNKMMTNVGVAFLTSQTLIYRKCFWGEMCAVNNNDSFNTQRVKILAKFEYAKWKKKVKTYLYSIYAIFQTIWNNSFIHNFHRISWVRL